jgi:N-acyl-phosphatidylethanolamine-hydrolysing phospholipase D
MEENAADRRPSGMPGPDVYGRYRNPWPTRAPGGHETFVRWVFAHRLTRPSDPPAPVLERVTPDFAARAAADQLVLTWIGHSTVLVQIGGLNVLTDPVWANRASPFSFIGPRRRLAPAVSIEALPPIDVVVISHNHYDHLDRSTVRRLAGLFPNAEWVTPNGVASLVASAGARNVTELTWWEDRNVKNIAVTCVPAQHSSGRFVRDRNRSLWCGWTIATNGGVRRAVYFAGDTAYCPVFIEIGSRLGPFDACLLPIGAYEPRWYMQYVHMTPEEAVRAFEEVTQGDVAASSFVPIHWGTFRIADDALDEPPRRLCAAWSALKFPPESLAILRHGETRRYWVGAPNVSSTR